MTQAQQPQQSQQPTQPQQQNRQQQNQQNRQQQNQQNRQQQNQQNRPLKSAAPKKAWGAHVLAPIAWVAKSAAWITNPTARGGFQFLAYTMAVGSLILSSETVYMAMPLSQSSEQAGIENPRALPKPGIDDGANIAYLNPVPMVGNVLKSTSNVVTGWLPFGTSFELSPKWTLWGDFNWYAAIAIAAAIGGVEAMAIRRIGTWEQKKAKFQKLNAREMPDLNPKAVMSAKFAKVELATEGAGDYATMALLIVLVYGVEFYAFFRSVSGIDIPGFTLFAYALINVFGFETAWSIGQRASEEKE
jgi:hypothetical protein